MPQKAVSDAVAARLAALWSTPPVIEANREGDTPADGSPFLVVQYPVANPDRYTVNEGVYREDGTIRFVLHAQRGSGTNDLLTWAEQLQAMFRYKKFGGVETRSPSSPLIHDDNEEGNYFRASVVVPYTYTFEDAS